ncbi:50S ribosomal protein L15 [Candidatus Wolfebacteria bacterium]|nr:50S ribosomal protein L15 [Candidatus Wolfebacteria bacterium]
MQLHELQRKTPLRRKKRVGRGGKRGKTSGRGHKGQKARAGHKMRPEMRDIIKKLPKRRGYGKNRGRTVNPRALPPQVVNLRDLEGVFAEGDEITPRSLLEKGLVRRGRGGIPRVKILSVGDFTKRCKVSGCKVSASALEKLTKAGTTVVS